MAEKKKKEKGKLWKEFKAFISKGDAFMLAVGVVIGGAFNAIVNSLVNILLSVCTWAVPGGLKGLVSVLPAVNKAQEGMDAAVGLGQKFDASKLQALAEAEAKAIYGADKVEENLNLVESAKTTILSKYTLHGTVYTYNMSAVIDWGSFINACISFLIIALVLFIIVKAINTAEKKNAEFKAKLQEEYYEKHPEERPAPVVPGAPAPTEAELLTQILAELKKQNAGAAAPAPAPENK